MESHKRPGAHLDDFTLRDPTNVRVQRKPQPQKKGAPIGWVSMMHQ